MGPRSPRVTPVHFNGSAPQYYQKECWSAFLPASMMIYCGLPCLMRISVICVLPTGNSHCRASPHWACVPQIHHGDAAKSRYRVYQFPEEDYCSSCYTRARNSAAVHHHPCLLHSVPACSCSCSKYPQSSLQGLKAWGAHCPFHS